MNLFNKIFRKKNPKEIPQEILSDFEEAERRYQESNGETDPHRILWDIAKSKGGRYGGFKPKPSAQIAGARVSTSYEGYSNKRNEVSGNATSRTSDNKKPVSKAGGFHSLFRGKR